MTSLVLISRGRVKSLSRSYQEPHESPSAACRAPVREPLEAASSQVVRYHSLLVDESTLPPQLLPIAWTGSGPDRVLMALAHDRRPHFGVQAHPPLPGCTPLCLCRLVHAFHGGLPRSIASADAAAVPLTAPRTPRRGAC